jgi:diguanylate cyclase (GGDEF)-like protein
MGWNGRPALDREIVGSQWVTVGGARDYVQRRPIAQSGWSLVTMTASQGIYASRVWGIIITLQMATLALVYLVGRERWVHDNIQLQKRLDLEEVARHLDLRAATDPLTGLYNRRKLYRELATEMQRAQRYKTPLSVVLFDVDHFKDVNDGHGHQAGDVVLVELSRAVAARIRATDVLARWGGEEFLILTPGSDGEMASQLARNLGDAIRALVIGKVAEVTCSFGVAEFEQADTAETIIARADEALYRAKIGGRDRVELASTAVLAQAS